jgi:dCMP deaminase
MKPDTARLKDWDKYFFAFAQVVFEKSKDPRCAVGAVIVSPDKPVLSTGFNGLARGVNDGKKLLAHIEAKL